MSVFTAGLTGGDAALWGCADEAGELHAARARRIEARLFMLAPTHDPHRRSA